MSPCRAVQRSRRHATTGGADARPEIRRQPVPDHGAYCPLTKGVFFGFYAKTGRASV